MLWVGNALQQLDPSPARHAIEPLDSRLGTLDDQSNTALREIDPGHQTLAETLEALSSREIVKTCGSRSFRDRGLLSNSLQVRELSMAAR